MDPRQIMQEDRKYDHSDEGSEDTDSEEENKESKFLVEGEVVQMNP